MKLSAKILLASLLPLLAIIVTYHFLSSNSFSGYLVNIFHQHADSSLSQTEEDIRRFFIDSEHHLQLLADINPPDQQQPMMTTIAFRILLRNVESFFRLSAINVNGKEWLRINKFQAYGDDEQDLINVFASPVYQHPMLDLSPYLGNISKQEDFPLPFLDISVPVKDRRSGDISGIIWAKLSFQEIQALLERYLPQKGKVMLIRSDNGEVLVEADDTRTDFTTLETEVIQEVLQNKKSRGWLEKSQDCCEATFTYRKFNISDLGFLLLYYQPNETIYFLANRLKEYNMYLALTGFVLFVLTSFLLIKKVTTPLTTLTGQIRNLGLQYQTSEGKGNYETVVAHGDEVEQLRYVFSIFQDQLSSYSREIETFNQTLEQQVAEKTKKLADLNLVLEDTNDNLKQDIARRLQVEKELEKHQHHLKKMVHDRTAQLSATNTKLENEIEERRNAQKALTAEKERLSVTLKSIGDAVITTDIQGNIVLMNKVAEKLTGWSLDDSVGRSLHEVFHLINEKTGEHCQSPVDVVLRSGEIVDLANYTVLVARDGSKRNIADSAAPIRDKESLIIGVVLVFRDVTEKRKMEEELLKVRKLDSVALLAEGIAHDFNNILAAIVGNISLAALLVKPEEKVHKLLLDAEKAAFRAKELTFQLLTFSKGGEPIKQIASISEIIKDSADFVLRGSNVRCNYNIPADILPVSIDAGQISQVIQNIVINADQAMPSGGVIDISCENFVKDENQSIPLPKGEYVKISITDRGIGIPPNLLDKVFDPFFTTKQDGSGLGLAITHSIISKHHGYIFVESEQGVGTMFTIYIKASKVEQVVKPDKEVPLQVKGGGKILVMDDEEMIRDLLQEMLSHFGYDVLLAEDGVEALQIYQQQLGSDKPIDVVIMDLTIPGGMGGKETIMKLLKIDPAAKVIVSSGYSKDPVISNYEDHGFAAAVNKPFKASELHAEISKLLGKPVA